MILNTAWRGKKGKIPAFQLFIVTTICTRQENVMNTNVIKKLFGDAIAWVKNGPGLMGHPVTNLVDYIVSIVSRSDEYAFIGYHSRYHFLLIWNNIIYSTNLMFRIIKENVFFVIRNNNHIVFWRISWDAFSRTVHYSYPVSFKPPWFNYISMKWIFWHYWHSLMLLDGPLKGCLVNRLWMKMMIFMVYFLLLQMHFQLLLRVFIAKII